MGDESHNRTRVLLKLPVKAPVDRVDRFGLEAIPVTIRNAPERLRQCVSGTPRMTALVGRPIAHRTTCPAQPAQSTALQRVSAPPSVRRRPFNFNRKPGPACLWRVVLSQSRFRGSRFGPYTTRWCTTRAECQAHFRPTAHDFEVTQFPEEVTEGTFRLSLTGFIYCQTKEGPTCRHRPIPSPR